MILVGDGFMGDVTRSIASLITNRKIKYAIIVFWLAVVALAAPLAGRLSEVEKNEAKSWLPGSAESTQVLDAQAAFASPNTIPAVVVYERTTGLTPADHAKIAADAKTFAALPNIDGSLVGPIGS